MPEQVGFDHGTQVGIDRRAETEPAFEAGHGLMQKHAEPVDRIEAGAARVGFFLPPGCLRTPGLSYRCAI